MPEHSDRGIPKASSTKHLVTTKTWMKHLEEKKENGIFQTFDLEKFFDKESLLDTMDTLKREARISDKCYRLWFKLNENASVAVTTSVGTSEFRTVKNSVGQGMFGVALATSLNIGSADVEKVVAPGRLAPRRNLGHRRILGMSPLFVAK